MNSLWWNLPIVVLFFISMGALRIEALGDRSERSYTQKVNRICPAAACDFRLGPVRVPGSLRIQPRCCSYAAACRCGNGKCWLLRDKGLDSSPCWKHPRKARTWNDWRGKMNMLTYRRHCVHVRVRPWCVCKNRTLLKSFALLHNLSFSSPLAVSLPLLNH